MGTFQEVNNQIFSAFTFSNILNVLGWVFVAILVIGGAAFGLWWYYTSKQFGKKIQVFELINGCYQPAFKDSAKTVKLGKGGFEILYLRKRKVYRIAFGGRIGRDTYYYFILPDGYWHNGLLSGQITIDGKIPIISTNPSARAQYTALEKHVDDLFAQKKSFWEQYGNWVLSGVFILIMGVLGWLMFREMSSVMSAFPQIIDRLSTLIDECNRLLVAVNSIAHNTTTGSLVSA